MPKSSLQRRLFYSHFMTVLLSMGIVTLVSATLNPYLFDQRLETLHLKGELDPQSDEERSYIARELHDSWGLSMLLAIATGTLSTLTLSTWVARRINQPIQQMTAATQTFSEGNHQARMPLSDIPELNYLSQGFNRMATGLEDAEQKRKALVSDLTHELRTPLTVTRGHLERLQEGKSTPSPDLYDRMIHETRRLERLVNSIQELSKAEAASIPLKLGTIQLDNFLPPLVQRFADQVIDEPTLNLDNVPKRLQITADLDHLEQILVNLIGNAIQYTEKGSITVRAIQDQDQVWIEVQDTGIGIAPEQLPAVFERFWRADQARERRSGGTGIGLAITKALVELQGGTIEVHSQLHQGSTFRFCLPCA